LSFGITAFDVSALMQDGTTKTAFTTADDWTDIKSVTFGVSGADTFRGSAVTRTAQASFFPRNILSH
jgi:hypothetical protein